MKQYKSSKYGFTLIEILVVVLIIAVLSAIGITGYRKATEKAKATHAVQVLSDVAKAEIDFYYAHNSFTKDFGDLVISEINKDTGNTVTGNKYTTELFEYKLEDKQNLTTAKRSITNDAYTLYRFFEDPRTYCQPAGNKYCEILGLEPGTFTHSVGRWQSCEGGVYPCNKSCTRDITVGYTCTGTYNEDGTFKEKVCDSNNICLTTQYNEDEKGLKTSSCGIYDTNGKCTSGGESTYDEDGNLLSYKKCTAWAEDGTCATYKSGSNAGYVYTYDANGNMTSYAECSSWNSDGTCATYGTGGYVYTYDANGNRTSVASCKSWNSDGTCGTYSESGAGEVYSYDENGNQIRKSKCSEMNTDGTCNELSSTSCFLIDENGHKSQYEC